MAPYQKYLFSDAIDLGWVVRQSTATPYRHCRTAITAVTAVTAFTGVTVDTLGTNDALCEHEDPRLP